MAVTNNFYDQAMELAFDNDGDYQDHSHIIMLVNSSHVFTQANTLRTDVNANELATGSGYTQSDGAGAGEALASITSAQSGGTYTWDAADSTWTASGGDIGPADDGVIFNDTIASPLNALINSIDFDGSQTAGDGTDFKVVYNASGIFTVA